MRISEIDGAIVTVGEWIDDYLLNFAILAKIRIRFELILGQVGRQA